MAAGWSTQTEVCVVLMLAGFAIAFVGHAGGSGDFNWAIILGWSLMVAGFIGVAWL